MHVRSVLALAGVAGLLAVPFAVASPDDGPVQSANGGIHWTIPLPNPFGVEVGKFPTCAATPRSPTPLRPARLSPC